MAASTISVRDGYNGEKYVHDEERHDTFISATYVAFNHQYKSHQVTPEELRCFQRFIEEQRVKLGKEESTVFVREKKPLDSLVFGDS